MPFQAENLLKSWAFSGENNAQTILNIDKAIFKRSRKRLFWPRRRSKLLSEGVNLNWNFNFQKIIYKLSSQRNIRKIGPFTAQNNVTSKWLQSRIQNVQETTFWSQLLAKMTNINYTTGVEISHKNDELIITKNILWGFLRPKTRFKHF